MDDDAVGAGLSRVNVSGEINNLRLSRDVGDILVSRLRGDNRNGDDHRKAHQQCQNT